MSKEDRAEKENIPPTPPIREKGQTEEMLLGLTRAREKDLELDLRYSIDEMRRRYINRIPSLKQVLSFSRLFLDPNKATPEIIEEWYRQMCISLWCDGDGNPIHNWGRNLAMFVNYYAVNKRRADPERIPDARKKDKPRHADNYIAADEDFKRRFVHA